MAIAEVSRIDSQRPRRAGAAPVQATGVALVPVVAVPHRLEPIAHSVTRPDPTFVAHLIAMSQHSPQTRLLRRATPEDAQVAYRSVASRDQKMMPPGVRTRHIA